MARDRALPARGSTSQVGDEVLGAPIALAGVTWSAGDRDIVDRVRPALRKRYDVVSASCTHDQRLLAVGASTTTLLEEVVPLLDSMVLRQPVGPRSQSRLLFQILATSDLGVKSDRFRCPGRPTPFAPRLRPLRGRSRVLGSPLAFSLSSCISFVRVLAQPPSHVGCCCSRILCVPGSLIRRSFHATPRTTLVASKLDFRFHHLASSAPLHDEELGTTVGASRARNRHRG